VHTSGITFRQATNTAVVYNQGIVCGTLRGIDAGKQAIFPQRQSKEGDPVVGFAYGRIALWFQH